MNAPTASAPSPELFVLGRRFVDTLERDLPALAARIESVLFPRGAPARVTLLVLFNAALDLQSRQADAFLQVELAYTAAQKARGRMDAKAPSITPGVAATIGAMEREMQTWRERWGTSGARIDREIFPEGMPEQLDTLAWLERVTTVLDQVVEGLEDGDIPAEFVPVNSAWLYEIASHVGAMLATAHDPVGNALMEIVPAMEPLAPSLASLSKPAG